MELETDKEHLQKRLDKLKSRRDMFQDSLAIDRLRGEIAWRYLHTRKVIGEKKCRNSSI